MTNDYEAIYGVRIGRENRGPQEIPAPEVLQTWQRTQVAVAESRLLIA